MPLRSTRGPAVVAHDGDDPQLRFDPTRHAPLRLGAYAWEGVLRAPGYLAARRAGRPARGSMSDNGD